MSDRPDADISSWQHSQETYIHAAGGIRTHNPSKRAAADPRHRPRGHWDRHTGLYTAKYINIIINIFTFIIRLSPTNTLARWIRQLHAVHNNTNFELQGEKAARA